MTQPSQRSRPYDDFIPAPTLERIKQRRFSPDGLVHEVKTIVRAGRRVYNYPWKKMELGDFFIVPVEHRSKNALRVAFQQGAARHDLEIAVKEWTLPDGALAYRVTVVIIQVSRYKLEAANRGITGIGFSDGRWRARKRKWYKEHSKDAKRVSRIPPPAPAKSKPRDLDNPFWADEAEDA
jgi:hypothetical protein